MFFRCSIFMELFLGFIKVKNESNKPIHPSGYHVVRLVDLVSGPPGDLWR